MLDDLRKKKVEKENEITNFTIEKNDLNNQIAYLNKIIQEKEKEIKQKKELISKEKMKREEELKSLMKKYEEKNAELEKKLNMKIEEFKDDIMNAM